MYLASQCSSRCPSFKFLDNCFRFSSRKLSSLAQIKEDLLSRKFESIPDYPTPIPAYLLSRTLQDVLPARYKDLFRDGAIYTSTLSEALKWTANQRSGSLLDIFYPPPTYHLVYFPSPTRLSSLLPDGTDPLHSPGPPFMRRLWAGCRINEYKRLQLSSMRLRMLCNERVLDVECKGLPGEEKLFVHIERIIVFEGKKSPRPLQEIRTLVFMRDYSNDKNGGILDVTAADGESAFRFQRRLSERNRPDFSHTFKPSTAMLFRFSALTFNAHAIHLDPQYCQAIEGHPKLLVHGPLTTILLAEMLRVHLADRTSQGHVNAQMLEASVYRFSYSVPRLQYIDTKNIAPLYADEPMTLYGRLLEGTAETEERWQLWIEDSQGSLAAKATATTTNFTHRLP